MSRTFVTMEVSARTYDEVSAKLQEAGYGQAFDRSVEPPLLDMHGIALERTTEVDVTGGPVTFTVKSQYGAFSVRTALLRAAFHLKKQGYGAEDIRVAEIIEQLEWKVNT